MDPIGRVVVLVLDGVGIGPLPDAASYGDEGSDTLGNIARHLQGLSLPELRRWGLGNIAEIPGIEPVPEPAASYGKMRELSPGKDSTSGHWELMGCPVETPFPVYPDGFPPEVTRTVAEIAGVPPLGNVVASGTEIIEELGAEHLRTGRPILYTSADSVLQVAAHTKVWTTSKLHSVCATLRDRLVPPHQVARVIARPFFGEPGQFVRTQERKDFTVPPVKTTALDLVKDQGYPVVGVGKISDLFAGRGLTVSRPAKGLDICCEEILSVLASIDSGLVLANLGDFDTLWGHRNDIQGFANGLAQFDQWIPELERSLRPGKDLVVLTGDHGCDPTTPSTDHSREFVPLLVWNGGSPGVPLGERTMFADVAATALAFLQVPSDLPGASFLSDLPAPTVPRDGTAAPGSPLPDSEAPEGSIEGRDGGMPDLEGMEATGLPHGEEIAQLVKEIQEDLPFSVNLFHTVLQQEGQVAPDLVARYGVTEHEQTTFMGTLLVSEGVLTHETLADLLGLTLARWLDQGGNLTGEVKRLFETRTKGTFWGESLLEEGLVSEEQLAAFYVRSCGIPYIQLSGYRVPREAAEVLPRESAVASGILPIAKDGDRITVATSRPADSRLIEDVASWTKCEVRTVLAMSDQLMEALGKVYVEGPAEETPEAGKPVKAIEPAPASHGPSVPAGGSSGLPGGAPGGVELAWLLHAAKAMTKNSYAPHSGLRVGAAVLADNGEVFAGCNVENDSFGLSMCAERVAIYKAVSSGRREVKAVAVVADGIRGIKPCGACLQVVRQFGPKAVFVFEADGEGVETRSLKELLPYGFSLKERKT